MWHKHKAITLQNKAILKLQCKVHDSHECCGWSVCKTEGNRTNKCRTHMNAADGLHVKQTESYRTKKCVTHVNAVGILRAWEEEGGILRNMVGGDEGVNGWQSLHKLLCGQLHGQEAAKLNQRVLTLKMQYNTLYTSVSWPWKCNTSYTSVS